MKRPLILLLILAMAVPVLFLGCTGGDDGAAGAAGISTLALVTNEPAGANCANGGQKVQTGADKNGNSILDAGEVTSTNYVCNGTSATAAANPESCAVCHQGQFNPAPPFGSVAAVHASKNVVTTASLVSVVEGASLDITFNITVDGVPNNSFTLRRAYVNWDNTARQTVPPTPPLITSFQRDTLYQVADNGAVTTDVGLGFTAVAGTYTVTIPTAYQIDNSTYLIQLQSATSSERPVVVAQWGAAHLRDLVSNTGCASCHGPYPAWSDKFQHYAVGGSECQICHSRFDRNINFISKDATGALVDTGPVVYGTNIVEYVHGIHNSHNMPNKYRGAGAYYRTDEPDATATVEDRYSIGYPSDMRNCSVCHETPAQLAAAASAPPSYYLCMTCHNNWDGFVRGEAKVFVAGDVLGDIHLGLPTGANCMVSGCHLGRPTKDEAADFHNSFNATAQGTNSFYRGEDISFSNPNDVSFQIDNVTVSGANVTFKWTASKNSVAVNPCNDNIDVGPTFRGLAAYLAYAKGDDWVNENVSTSPGQPAGSRNLFTSLATTCASNVATTTGLTIASGTDYAEKALLAITGKSLDQGTFTIGTAATKQGFFVRVPSPTYAFSMTDGSAVAKRRDAVNTANCLKCHRGTLYQHGGDRVDNEQLCVICHNPASNEKDNRKETTGSGSSQRYGIVNLDGTVDTSKTYDGKVGETYDMRTLLHSIHGIEQRGNPIVIYRTRGIYAFVPPVYETIGSDTFERAYPPPTGWPLVGGITVPATDNNATVYGATTHTRQIHNWTVVHYPRRPSECTACHNPGAYEPPDQTKAVGLTIDPGNSYPVQSDDTLIGPAAAACTACHTSPAVKGHAASFGYRGIVTRDALLELSQP